jgi:hypothetical protein
MPKHGNMRLMQAAHTMSIFGRVGTFSGMAAVDGEKFMVDISHVEGNSIWG